MLEASPSGGPEPAKEPAEVSAPAVADPGRPGSERERILEALEAHRWRREEAAQALGISRTTLWRRMRELGLED